MKENRKIINIKAIKLGINGEAIAYKNKKTVFVPYLLPKEEADVEVCEEKGNVIRAKIAKIFNKSEKRQEPKCDLFGLCGGCTLQHLEYFEQLKQKRGVVLDALGKYCKTKSKINVSRTIGLEEEYNYRNKVQIPLENKNGSVIAGFYKTNSNHMLKVDTCPIQIEQLNFIVSETVEKINNLKLKAYDRRQKIEGIKHLVVRYSYYLDKVQVTLVLSKANIKDKFAKLVNILKSNDYIESIYLNINDNLKSHEIFGDEWEHLYGKPRLREKLKDISYDLHPKSFFQLNTKQTVVLYDLIKDTLKLSGTENIIDAYCGVGSISLWLARECKKIRGVDINKDAIIDAKHNAKINGFENTHFEHGNSSSIIRKWLKKGFRADVLIVDPARQGLDNELLDLILASPIKKVLYVSCNPSTLAKNLNVLQNKYWIKDIIPVDMFGQTAHIENVVLLKRK